MKNSIINEKSLEEPRCMYSDFLIRVIHLASCTDYIWMYRCYSEVIIVELILYILLQ